MITEEERDKFDRIIEKAFPEGRLLHAWRLKGGISAEMTAFEIELGGSNRRKVILRQPGAGDMDWKIQAVRNEFELLQVLQTFQVAAPEPVMCDTSSEILSSPYLLLEYIDGEIDFSPIDRTDYAKQMADELARIHGIAESEAQLPFLNQRAERLSGELSFRPANSDTAFQVARIQDTLKHHWPIPQLNQSVLLHGDYWPGNVLWRGQRLAAIIDWEDALAGDPLIDLAISRLDIAWILGQHALNAFEQQYWSSNPVDESMLAYWDLWAVLRLVRLIGGNYSDWAGFFQPYRRPDITKQSIREDLRQFSERALERLHR
jgi:aminoglycoside phosphotransferase (APT) family kinase protein